jgi:hypothetical protein
MAKQICDGYTLLSPVMLKRLDVAQMKQLEFVMDKKLRETRGEPMDLSDQEGIQARNRRISRIENALRLVRHTVQQQRRSGAG